MNIDASSTDFFCMFPIIQQGIGTATFFSNMIKVIYDVARALFTQTWKGPEQVYADLQNAKDTSNDQEEKKITAEILSYPGYQFERHVLFMIIGIARAIPILGTIYSISIRNHFTTIRLSLDDPRKKA